MDSYQLDLCGLRVSFRTKASPERVEKARDYVDKLYQGFQDQGRLLGRERIMAMLLIGIADELLQLRQDKVDFDSRLDDILSNLLPRETDSDA